MHVDFFNTNTVSTQPPGFTSVDSTTTDGKYCLSQSLDGESWLYAVLMPFYVRDLSIHTGVAVSVSGAETNSLWILKDNYSYVFGESKVIFRFLLQRARKH